MFKKALVTFLVLAMLFNVGCFFGWTDDGVVITFLKDYDLEKKTSTSNKIKLAWGLVELETK